MKFKHLAEIFNQIEPVSSRLEMTRMLSELFKQADPEEARIISYMCLGELAAPYVGVQFNFAQKSAQKVIATLLNITVKDVQEQLKTVGDLGSIIEKGSWIATNDLTVKEVYDYLLGIEKITGSGSQELKLENVVNILKEVDPISAKYIIRIITATLRLGFSDMTLIDAFSWMITGDKSLRDKIENAYNLCADIGLIAFTIKKDGIEAVEKLKIHVGIPIRMAAAERLPSADDIVKKLGHCIAQPKLDGFRLQVHRDGNTIRLFSRNLLDMSNMFPELVEAFLKIDVQNIICEGEAVAYDPNTGSFQLFQETVKRRRKHDIDQMANELPLKLFVFDILYLNNASLLNNTHVERRDKLELIFNDPLSIIQPIEQKEIHTTKELEQYFMKNIEAGLEGLVVKRADSQYQPGKRNFNWIKLKREAKGELDDTIDCVVLGYYYGEGKRAKFGIGAFLAGVYNKDIDGFQTIAKVGSGFTDEGWTELRAKCDLIKDETQPKNVYCDKNLAPDVWVYPEIVCEVLADELTMSPIHTAGKTEEQLGIALRFPRFIKYRTDKSANETTSIVELFEMYQMQYNTKK